jgi:hypothetical protein
VARGDVAQQVGFAAAVQRAAVVLVQPLRVQHQVAPVSVERQLRQAVFDPQRVGEAVDRGLAVRVHPSARPGQSSASFCAATTFL